jgi:adenylate cyclase
MKWGVSVHRGLVLGLAIGCIGAVIGRLPSVLRVDEMVGLGTLYALSGPPALPEEVAVVAISHSTYDELGVSDELDEWPRYWHARLIERLRAAAPAVILFDVSFTEPRDPADDAALAAAISAAGNVILLERTSPVRTADGRNAAAAGIVLERREPPLPVLREAALGTAPFTLPSVPIRLSQFWIFDRTGANVPNLPALALHAYASFMLPDARKWLDPRADNAIAAADARATDRVSLDRTSRALRDAFVANALSPQALSDQILGDARVQSVVDALTAMYAGPPSGYLRYYGPPGTLKTIPYENVVAGETRSTQESVDVAGKVVFVGISEITPPDQQDVFYSVYSDMSGRSLSGVEIGATAFANLLHREIVRPLGMWPQTLLLLVWGVIIGLCAMVQSHRMAWVLCASVVLGYVAATAVSFAAPGLWLPTFTPLAVQLPLALLLAGLWKYVGESAHRIRVQEALASFAPEGAVSGLDRAPMARDRGRRLMQAACIVTDVHGYTALAERLQAHTLADLMNEYYESLFGVVARHGGIVTDTAGDSMVAVWECERDREDALVRACQAAMAIDETVAQFNRRHPDAVLATGIGVDCGQIMMANIGSERRFNYHAVGNAVNTAARIQGLTGRLGTNVLVSEHGYARHSALPSRELGEFWLAGKAEYVGIFELRERPKQAGLNESEDEFVAGLAAFRAGDIERARQWFDRAANAAADDGPARFYRIYCESLLADDAHATWDGRVVIATK